VIFDEADWLMAVDPGAFAGEAGKTVPYQELARRGMSFGFPDGGMYGIRPHMELSAEDLELKKAECERLLREGPRWIG
jgi:hypothetical protein